MLGALERRGIAWGIVTNKPGWLTDPLLIEVKLHKRVRAVVSGDTLSERKPHPLPLLHAAKTIGVEPGECVFVGDAERDAQAAKAAGMYSLIAGFGYIGDDDRADEWFQHGWLNTPLDLLAWLDKPRATPARARKQRQRMSAAWLIAVIAALAAALIGYLVGTLRAARARRNSARRARRSARAKLASPRPSMRARTAELLRAERGAGARRRRERFAPRARCQQRNLPQARARSVRPRSGRGHQHAQGARGSHQATGGAAQGGAGAAGRTGPGRRTRTPRIHGQTLRPDRKPREGAGPPAARDAQSLHGAAPARKCAAAGARSRCVAWSNSPACPNTAISPSRNTSPPRVARCAPTCWCACPMRAASWSMPRLRSMPTWTRAKRRTTNRGASRWSATRSRSKNACASSARRVTGSSSRTAPNSRCCSCRAISSCRRRWPSGPT